jgi:flagellar secretion chaperone FliS
MESYKARALESASGIDLVIALYDGIIRFMHRAMEAVDRGDAGQRRAAVKRAMDIVIHLQATLKRDQGGKPAECLSEFYAAMFALMLQGSLANSREKFEQVIACVWNVRDAWRQVAADPAAMNPAWQRMAAEGHATQIERRVMQGNSDSEFSTNWTA